MRGGIIGLCLGSVIGIALLFHAGHGANSLTASPSAIRFGRVPVGTVITQVVRLRNAGSAPITILRAITSCGCTTAEIAGTVLPGRDVPLKITFNSAEKFGGISKLVSVFVAGKEDPVVSIPIIGETYEEIRCTPERLDFGDMRIGAKYAASIVLARPDGKPLHVLNVQTLPGVRTTVVEGQGGTPKVAVTLDPAGQIGYETRYLRLRTDDDALPMVTVPIYSNVIGLFDATPNVIDFGEIEPDGVATATARIVGPHASHMTVEAAPPGMHATLTSQAENIAVLTITRGKGGIRGSVINDKIILETAVIAQPKVTIPVVGAIQINS